VIITGIRLATVDDTRAFGRRQPRAQVIIHLPASVTLVSLSATVSNYAPPREPIRGVLLDLLPTRHAVTVGLRYDKFGRVSTACSSRPTT
jgi:hypothetical protein